jgi:hypothetical protein
MAAPRRAPFASRWIDPRTPPCPHCDGPGLIDRPVPADGLEARLECAACGSRYDAVIGVTCLAVRRVTTGGCCAGFRRHEITFQDPAGPPGAERRIDFEVWTQDPVWIRPEDRFTVLLPAATGRRRRPPAPDAVANLTLGAWWPLIAPTKIGAGSACAGR